MDDRFSLCNMAIEAGAKNGIIAPDSITREFLANRPNLRAKPKEFFSDPDAHYTRILTIDISKLEPVIAYPYLPSNGKSISEMSTCQKAVSKRPVKAAKECRLLRLCCRFACNALRFCPGGQ